MFKLFFSYWSWHYSEGLKDLFRLERNFVSFIFHFFAIKDLSLTLFLPWQLLSERYKGGFDIKEWFSFLIVNILMRLVGFFMRSMLIVLGLISALVVFVLSIIFTLVWILMPFILSAILFGALKQIF